jgi:ABC-type polysaccharide/polyol phosphate transport system ATPase subunit
MYDDPKDRFREAFGNGKKSYHRDFYALNKVSFRVGKGEIVGIVGRNGSGKSTILKILTGVLTPTSGSVTIDGKVSALLELGAGFNMEYTGMKNIYLNATMMRVSHEEIEKKIPDILAFADIGDYINQPVKTYSSGMFVRLAFAVAINVDPDILIVDEALAVGDTRFQLKCMDKFMEFVNQGKTILFVSHDVNSIKRFCNRAIWMNNGIIVQDGNTDEVTDHYLDFLKSELPIDQYLKDCSTSSDTDESMENDKGEDIDVAGIEIAEVKDLRIYNMSGQEIDDIKHGEHVKLKVRYIVSDESIEEPVLGVAIRRIDNEYICGLNTKLDNVKISWKRGYNEIELDYPCFNLIGGEYYFDVGIFDKTGIVNLEYKTKIKSFFVKMDYIAEGIVVLNHRWNVRKML